MSAGPCYKHKFNKGKSIDKYNSSLKTEINNYYLFLPGLLSSIILKLLNVIIFLPAECKILNIISEVELPVHYISKKEIVM